MRGLRKGAGKGGLGRDGNQCSIHDVITQCDRWPIARELLVAEGNQFKVEAIRSFLCYCARALQSLRKSENFDLERNVIVCGALVVNI